MNFKALFQIVLLFALPVNAVQAEGKIKTLRDIGEYAVHRPPLKTQEDLCAMMQKKGMKEQIFDVLKEAPCPKTNNGRCSELHEAIYRLFPSDCSGFKSDAFRDVQYGKNSVQFSWMLFRSKEEGKLKIAENLEWGGEESLPAFEFTLSANDHAYIFTVPKGCGNLALLKKDCPDCEKCEDDCRTLNCDACSDDCVKNPKGKGCPGQCQKCNKLKCIRLVDKCKDCPGPNCPDECTSNPCKDCSQCSDDCKRGGKCESKECQTCQDEKCFVSVRQEINLCENCDQCSDDCVKNPKGKGCPNQCQKCNDLKCTRLIETCKNCPGPSCPDECKSNPCKDCSQCSDDCKRGGKCESKECQTCQDEKCFVQVPTPEPYNICKDCGQCKDDWACLADDSNGNCSEKCAQCKNDGCVVGLEKPCDKTRFLADIGYYRQSDPADYLFGRFGIEYKPFAQDSSFKDVSLLTMIGIAPRIKGDDGDDALLLDIIAQYNVPSPDMFIGLGLGGWFTSGDVNHDSADSDLDIIANIGLNVGEYVGKKNSDFAVFFEVRSAVDELDALAEYGRFGAGVRFRF